MLEFERIIKKGIIPESFFTEEIRNGFLVTTERKKIWAIELDMFFEVMRICKKYDIKYYVLGGSLLGAVRHNGFIPWDDDIDLMMCRKDYERFSAVAQKELEDPYFFQTPNTDNCWCDFARICNSNTTGIRKILRGVKNVNKGIFIDIFPVDAISDNTFIRKSIYKLVALHSRLAVCYSFGVSNTWMDKIVNSVLQLPFIHMNIKKIYKCANKIASLVNAEKAHQMGIVVRTPYAPEKLRWSKEVLKDKITIPFEFFNIEIPARYDEILKTNYGDYMVFPPVEERGRWHDIIFDPDMPFEKYCAEHNI